MIRQNSLRKKQCMKNTLTLVFVLLLSSAGYGQIVADHTVVDKIDDIPQYYIDQVKKMFLSVPGQSHSEGYYTGLLLLQQANPKFAVNVTRSGIPESYTSSHLGLQAQCGVTKTILQVGSME